MILPSPAQTRTPSPAKSRGPNTDEGKQRVRLNALKHGLSGDAMTFVENRPELFEERLATWRASYAIRNEHDEWVFRMLIAESLRIEHCRKLAVTLTAEFALGVDLTWERDARRSATELAERLAKKPETTCAKLQSSKYGCELLADRWDGLARVLEANGDWDDSQKNLALDLLGIDPRLRAGHRLFNLGEPDVDLKLLEERAAFVVAQAAKLREAIRDSLDEIDQKERALAKAGVFLVDPKPLATIRRYEKECTRRYDQYVARLEKQAAPAPAFEFAPAPSPVATEASEDHEATEAPDPEPTLSSQDEPVPPFPPLPEESRDVHRAAVAWVNQAFASLPGLNASRDAIDEKTWRELFLGKQARGRAGSKSRPRLNPTARHRLSA